MLVWALDRFIGESVAEVFVNVQKLLRYDVQVVSYTEEHFRTNGPAGALMIPIAAWIAQQERIRISERTKAGLATARVQGKRLGRPWIVFPRGRVAADHKLGMSWRQLERKHHVPQSTLRNAIQKLAAAGVHNRTIPATRRGHALRKNRNERIGPTRGRWVGEVESVGTG